MTGSRFLKTCSQGIFWLVVGGILAIAAFIKPEWFVLQLPWFDLPVAILAIAYGTINLVLWQQTKRSLALSSEDVETYGERLSEITPGILHHWDKGMSVKLIAVKYEKERGIPQRVTLLYIIELLRDLQARQNQKDPMQISTGDE